MEITNRQMQMITPRGFDRLFEQEIQHSKTYQAAFKNLNSEYKKAFGKPRYKNYESYRITRRARIVKT